MAVPRHRALVLDQIDPHGLELLDQRGIVPFFSRTDCAAPDAIVLRSQVLTAADIPDSVQVVARAGVGTNNIPIAHCVARGIPVLNTPGANANAVRELVLAALLMVSRRLWPALWRMAELEREQPPDNIPALEAARWRQRRVEEVKRDYCGTELSGRELGVLGLGEIGRRVAESALGLGMRVAGFDPALSERQRSLLPSALRLVAEPGQLFEHSDFLSLHVPLLESTAGLIDDALLGHCRPGRGCCLLNFSRAPIVCPAAVCAALDDGRLAAYATDFYTEELAGRADVLCFPHLGASTVEAERNCAVMAVRQTADFLDTGSIENAVNFPASALEWHTAYRLSVSNRNLPRQLNAILSLLADSELNVANMHNGSSGDIAYNLIDLDQEPPADLCARIAGLDEILRVRLLRREPPAP